MSYEIKNYQEDFLEKQYELGNSVLSNWKGAGQSSVDTLKQAYSQPNFDPETKFYAFKDNEMVGFMTTSIQNDPIDGKKVALLEFPIVKPEYKDAIDPLFRTGIQKLKEKGVEVVRTRAGENWGYTLDLTQKYNYSFLNTTSKAAEFSLEEMDLSSLPEPGNIVELDFSVHRPELEKFIMEFYSMDENQAKSATDNLENIKDQSICHPLIFENGKLIGRVLAYYPNSDNKETAYLTNVLVRGETEEKRQELRERLFRYVFEKARNIPELRTFNIFATGPVLENLEQFNKLNIQFNAVFSFYEKQI